MQIARLSRTSNRTQLKWFRLNKTKNNKKKKTKIEK